MVVRILYADGSELINSTVGDARRFQRQITKTYNMTRRARRYASRSYTPILTIIQHDDGGVMVRFGKGRNTVNASDYAMHMLVRWLVNTREGMNHEV